ncbi:hypothetical protein EC915_10354 [Pseudomonas sp. LP_7_YM]|nr:hypothetical protein EC915_10354 [Pseudomonas sp. LP_7_YM]
MSERGSDFIFFGGTRRQADEAGLSAISQINVRPAKLLHARSCTFFFVKVMDYCHQLFREVSA